MDIRKLQRVIVDGLEDVKAQNIVVFNTEHLSPLFERVIIASGTSNRQTKSLASSVRDAVKGSGLPAPRVEGAENGEWIIVDCGPAVVHVMQPSIRDYYHLEELWGGKPVKMKLDVGAARSGRTAGPDVAPAAAEAPVRTSRKAAPREAPAQAPRKAASREAPAKATRQAAPRGAPVKAPRKAATKTTAERSAPPSARRAPAPRAVTRTVGVKRAATGAARGASAAPARSAAKKAPAKKATVRKAPAKKAAPRKSPTRR